MATSHSGPPLPTQKPRSALSAGIASVVVASILVLLKLWALWMSASLSIAASLTDSAMDLLMSVGAALAIVYAAIPADDDHAFGHSSVEDLTALAQSMLIALSAGFIAWSAVERLLSDAPIQLAAEGIGIAVMLISIALTLVLVWWQGHIARETGNKVIAADRLHYLGDLLPSIGAIIALLVSRYFNISGLDSIVALIAAGTMAFGASHIGKGAWDALMDRGADPALIEDLAQMARSWPGVAGFHDLKTRTAGSRIFVNLHIELDGDQSLRSAHDIGASLRRAMLERHPQLDIIIHKDVAAKNGHPGT